MEEDKENKGLGDLVESVIETIIPSTKENKCEKCTKRKEKLNAVGEYIKNNFNAKFG